MELAPPMRPPPRGVFPCPRRRGHKSASPPLGRPRIRITPAVTHVHVSAVRSQGPVNIRWRRRQRAGRTSIGPRPAGPCPCSPAF
eukprot:6276726-Pyramimonas_sp.AAC.1